MAITFPYHKELRGWGEEQFLKEISVKFPHAKINSAYRGATKKYRSHVDFTIKFLIQHPQIC